MVSSWRRSGSSSSVVLPASIVERMRQGEVAIADRFPEATILFSDLVGFTNLASRTCDQISSSDLLAGSKRQYAQRLLVKKQNEQEKMSNSKSAKTKKPKKIQRANAQRSPFGRPLS